MASSGRTRISDIASKLGVSTATVSRALSGNGYVREPLQAQIRAAAIEMNYALPPARGGQRVLIAASQAAMIDVKRSQFTTYVLEGLRERAEAQGIGLTTHIFDGYDSLPALREAATDPELIGLMLLTVEDTVIDYVSSFDLPVVLVNGDDPQMRISSVTPCNRSAASLATRHLMQMGHRRILFLTRPGRRTILRRQEGWRDALGDLYAPELVTKVEDWTAEAAAAAMQQAMASELSFTGIVAAGDILAVGAILALKQAGVDVPGQVSVIGIDGLPQGQYLQPALSAVEIPMRAVGAQALDLLIETQRLRGAGLDLPARRIELACRLIPRDSTATAPDGT